MTTTTHDPWATLPADWRTRHLPPTPRPRSRPFPHLKLPPTTCSPHCLRCKRQEQPTNQADGPMWKAQPGTVWKLGYGVFLTRLPRSHGTQAGCVWICACIAEPSLAKICVVTTRASARTVVATTGRQLLVVDVCPHCGRSHIHSPKPEHPYRRSGCGQPYVLEIR